MSRIRVSVKGVMVRQLLGAILALDGLGLKGTIMGMLLVAAQNLLVRIVVSTSGAHYPVGGGQLGLKFGQIDKL